MEQTANSIGISLLTTWLFPAWVSGKWNMVRHQFNNLTFGYSTNTSIYIETNPPPFFFFYYTYKNEQKTSWTALTCQLCDLIYMHVKSNWRNKTGTAKLSLNGMA